MRRRKRSAAYRARREERNKLKPRKIQQAQDAAVMREQESNYNESVAASLAGRYQ